MIRTDIRRKFAANIVAIRRTRYAQGMGPYIHNLPTWPEFEWDSDELGPRLAEVRYRQGVLLGRLAAIGFDARTDAHLGTVTSDVVKSAAIEGERLDPNEVRSSVARQLGLEVGGLRATSRQVDGVVEMLLDATQDFRSPLTAERLFGWHGALFPIGRSGMRPITTAAWRVEAEDPMRVVSGALGKQKIHFEAPIASRVPREMERFLAWFNEDAGDPVLRSGVAHLWFLTIHPFADGNGRIARALTDLVLARADDSSERFYSMSSQIAAERKDYYAQLESAQRGQMEITAWLMWFLGCFGRALDSAEKTLAGVLERDAYWRRADPLPLNARQREVLHRLQHDWEGFLTTSKYVKIAGCSSDTAVRDINTLIELGLLTKNAGGGRSTSYRMV